METTCAKIALKRLSSVSYFIICRSETHRAPLSTFNGHFALIRSRPSTDIWASLSVNIRLTQNGGSGGQRPASRGEGWAPGSRGIKPFRNLVSAVICPHGMLRKVDNWAGNGHRFCFGDTKKGLLLSQCENIFRLGIGETTAESGQRPGSQDLPQFQDFRSRDALAKGNVPRWVGLMGIF